MASQFQCLLVTFSTAKENGAEHALGLLGPQLLPFPGEKTALHFIHSHCPGRDRLGMRLVEHKPNLP